MLTYIVILAKALLLYEQDDTKSHTTLLENNEIKEVLYNETYYQAIIGMQKFEKGTVTPVEYDEEL